MRERGQIFMKPRVLYRGIAFGLLAGLTFFASAVTARDITPSVLTAGVSLPGSQQWTMRASGSGREYAIFVAVPDGPPPVGGYASIYVLDGNTMFFTAAEAVRAYARRRDAERETRALVIGIGYPDGTDVASARGFDFTPDLRDPRLKGPSGGAASFLDFIQNDLKPEIARRFPVDAKQQALMGHSYGGLFTLGVLLRDPDAFQSYVGMSSSFWFGNHDLSRKVSEFVSERAQTPTPRRVMLTVGEFEQRPAPKEWAQDPERASKMAQSLAERGQVVQAQEAAKQLAKVPGLLVDYREILNEDHGTVIPAAIGRGIDFILMGPRSIPPVPTAQEYARLDAAGRYRLRLEVRALPDAVRIPWLNKLKSTLGNGLDKETLAKLHDERQEMDRRYGTVPHAVNAD